MRKSLPLLFFLATAAFQLKAQQVSFFPQVGDGTVSTIRFQTSLFFVNTGGDTQVKVEFFNSQGQPISLTLQTEGGTLGPAPSFTIPLAAGDAFSAQTPGTGNLQVGYARLTAPASVGGTAVFSRSDAQSGVLLYEAGVPASPTLNSFSLFVDSLGNKDTGLAIVNPPAAGQAPTQDSDAHLTLTLYDKFFNFIATTPLILKPGEQFPRFVFEIFSSVAAQAREMEGVVTVESSDQAVAAVTLRQNDNPARDFPDEVPTLTTFPVVPGTAMSAAGGIFEVAGTQTIRTVLDLSGDRQKGIGIIYRFFQGQDLIQEHVQSLLTSSREEHLIPVPVEAVRIDRIEARLIYAGGTLGPSFELRVRAKMTSHFRIPSWGHPGPIFTPKILSVVSATPAVLLPQIGPI